MGERGSPCLTPLQYKTLEPGSPLGRTGEEVVHQSEEIQFLYFDQILDMTLCMASKAS
jgi:hypothetical protein